MVNVPASVWPSGEIDTSCTRGILPNFCASSDACSGGRKTVAITTLSALSPEIVFIIVILE
jgi:hypothetical protein